MERIAILVGRKGRGSNMLNLIRAFPELKPVVVSPADGTPAVAAAREHGAEVCMIDPKSDCYADDLITFLRQNQVALICLAGMMTLLPTAVLDAYPGRILNIHPALLPKFGGKGMYGLHVHEAVLAARETESGASVHYVTEHYDEGEVILQRKCPVMPDDTPETLAARVLACEHEAYPAAVRAVLALR